MLRVPRGCERPRQRRRHRQDMRRRTVPPRERGQVPAETRQACYSLESRLRAPCNTSEVRRAPNAVGGLGCGAWRRAACGQPLLLGVGGLWRTGLCEHACAPCLEVRRSKDGATLAEAVHDGQPTGLGAVPLGPRSAEGRRRGGPRLRQGTEYGAVGFWQKSSSEYSMPPTVTVVAWMRSIRSWCSSRASAVSIEPPLRGRPVTRKLEEVTPTP